MLPRRYSQEWLAIKVDPENTHWGHRASLNSPELLGSIKRSISVAR